MFSGDLRSGQRCDTFSPDGRTKVEIRYDKGDTVKSNISGQK